MIILGQFSLFFHRTIYVYVLIPPFSPTLTKNMQHIYCNTIQMYRKSCCTSPGVRVGSSIGIRKTFNFILKFLCDGQGAKG